MNVIVMSPIVSLLFRMTARRADGLFLSGGAEGYRGYADGDEEIECVLFHNVVVVEVIVDTRWSHP